MQTSSDADRARCDAGRRAACRVIQSLIGHRGVTESAIAEHSGLDVTTVRGILHCLELNEQAIKLSTDEGARWFRQSGKRDEPRSTRRASSHQPELGRSASSSGGSNETRQVSSSGARESSVPGALASSLWALQRRDRSSAETRPQSLHKMVSYLTTLRDRGKIGDDVLSTLLTHACAIFVESQVEDQVEKRIMERIYAAVSQKQRME